MIKEAEGIPPLDTQAWITAAHELVRNDEVELALKLLEMVPAYHRDHMPSDISKLRQEIVASLVTPHAYISSEYDNHNINPPYAKAVVQQTLRAQVILKEIQTLNASGQSPHIVDMGPGEYWLPIGLAELGCTFTYEPVALDEVAYKTAREFMAHLLGEPEPGVPYVYVAQEIIEHLHNPIDIATEALRRGNPEYVHLSTPLYTFDARAVQEKPRIRKGGLPHLRAYTPREFIAKAYELFPGYTWEYKTDAIQCLRGYRIGGPILGD